MMGTEGITATVIEDPEPLIPPGFGPFVAAASWGIQDDIKPADTHSSSVVASQSADNDVEILEHLSSSVNRQSDTTCSTSGSDTCRKSLRNRPPIDYSRFNVVVDEDSDAEVAEKQDIDSNSLKEYSEDVQNVPIAKRWNPSGARRPVLDEAPVFHPTEEKVDKLQNRKSSKKSRRGGMMKKRRRLSETDEINHNQIGMQQNQERFGFEPGPEFTLQMFQKYADDFSDQYFMKDKCRGSPPSVEDIEGEYWRIVERPTEEIEVIYGADLETGTFGSGFPKLPPEIKSDVDDEYAQSGWNLNNLPRLQGSVLSFEGGDISGVLVPWVYVGMCFSSFCWHVEDHHLYSLNYMHWGAPKMWYGVPGKDAVNLEAAMRKHLPELFEEQPDLLHNLVTQFSPSLLKSEGVPVYRCVQHEGEFVLTFPRAYHAGFNCGFNCAEAVNVAPIDWLPIGQNAVELYREQARKITISHDKLLLGAAIEAIRAQWDILFLKRNSAENLRWKSICGPDSTICKSLKARIEMELAQRKDICSPSQSRKMDAEFDSTDRECALCYYDLHLSASGCPCSPEKYACLVHAKQLCSCDWDRRIFLFRYDASTVSLVPSSEQKDNENKIVDICSPGMISLKVNQDMNSACTSVEQIKLGHVSPLKEPCVKNELSSPINSDTSCQQYNGVTGGHKSSSPSGQSFPSNSVTRPLITSGESTGSVHGLAVLKESRETLQNGYSTASLGVGVQLHNRSLSMIDNGANMKTGLESSNHSDRLMASDFNATLYHTYKDRVVITSETNTAVVPEKDSSQTRTANQQFVNTASGTQSTANQHFVNTASGTQVNTASGTQSTANQHFVNTASGTQSTANQHFMNNASGTQSTAKEHFVNTASGTQSASQQALCNLSSSKPLIDPSVMKSSYGVFGSGSAHRGHQAFGNPQLNERWHQRQSESLSGVEARARSHSAMIMHPALENHSRNGGAQKGPRIANVVHRFKCSVEPIEIGTVLSGRLWSSSQAIFPKGFKSRVKYFSITDPVQMSYYISEILDAGQQGPLFMKTVLVNFFINVSPTKCWNMVRERINMEIRRQLSMGRANLPTLQPPGSIDGLEMFGLLTPVIIQVAH
ncbi:hypothetical protein HU200_021671 [Digitaria exilis]|uniref:JmjC domain-containing protein n=1 Tax=Digitaria exilis TaxID=1010633 RepID=A0A835EZG2_9POAL|nr:hypothetical protein HU200_021671 [Digitaria exilis]